MSAKRRLPDRVKSVVQSALELPIALLTPNVNYVSGRIEYEELRDLLGYDYRSITPARMWKTQPHLRTVVSFIARNIAQLGLHVYQRQADGGRERDRTSLVAQLLDHVDGEMTTYDLVFALVGDKLLYDLAFWWVRPTKDSPCGWAITRIPPSWISVWKRDGFRVKTYRVQMNGKAVEIPAEQIIRFGGYDPSTYVGSSPAIDALRDTLQEQIEAQVYRRQIWKRGGRVSAVLQRPADAPEWSESAREAFREDWYAKYTGNGPLAGGVPILEDGMTLNRIDYSAQEQQYVEAAKLSLQTVASAYHVSPTMVGFADVSYANLREFHRMLYTDSLGPLLREISDRLNKSLLRMLALTGEGLYSEFNIAEKLSGSFEEQAAVLSSSTGRPWMTANEARARQNMPAIEGGDQLVIPLNVLIGGQASPRDTGSQNRVPGAEEEAKQRPTKAAVSLVKNRPPSTYEERAQDVLVAFFARQRDAIKSRLGAGREDWWDADRWDGELSDDLLRIANLTSTYAARSALRRAGLDPDLYDVDRTINYLREYSDRTSSSMNDVTHEQIMTALDADDADEQVDSVFTVATNQRAVAAAATAVTFCASFGTTEAARQQGSGKATKTWVVTSSNPRPSHAAIDGETVGLDEDFSIGLPWPGASGGDADEVAGCTCDLVVNFGG